jgi:hypothetical protein
MTHRRMVRTARLQVDMESFFLNWHQQELRHQELTCTEPRWLWRLKPGLPEGRDSAIGCGEVNGVPIILRVAANGSDPLRLPEKRKG